MTAPDVPKRGKVRAVAAIVGIAVAALVGIFMTIGLLFPDKIQDLGEPPGAEKTFSISFPTTWTRGEHSYGVVVFGASPAEKPGDPFRENISVVVKSVSRDMNGSDLTDLQTLAALAGVSGATILEKGKATLDGRQACWHVKSFTSNGVKMRNLQHFTAKSKLFFIITCTAPEETFDNYRPTFEAVVKTFQFK